MPIKGLTDRGLAFPEIGQIRKGSPKGEKGPGRDLDHFRVTFDERETEAQQTFLKRYTDKPTEINVILPFNELDRCWEAWLEAYTAGRMVARSDGEKFIYLVNDKGETVVKNGEPYTAYTEGQVVGHDHKGKAVYCKATGRLKIIVPELARAAYMTVLTTSVHDIANISGQLEAFKQINGGRIAGIPLVLRRRPKKISMPKDGQRVRVTKWMLSIEADPAWVKAKLIEVKSLALPGNGLVLLPELPSGNGHGPEPEIEKVESEVVEDEEDTEDIPSNPQMEEPPAPPEVITQNATQGELPINPSDAANDFWAYCYRTLNLNNKGAREILDKAGGDFVKALQAAKAV